MKTLQSLIDRVFLRGTDGEIIDPATEAKQNEVIGRLGSTTDAEAEGDGSLLAIVKRLRTLLGNLDAKDFATQETLTAALGQLQAINGDLDVALSTRATESTLAALRSETDSNLNDIEAKLTTSNGLLTTVRDHLDTVEGKLQALMDSDAYDGVTDRRKVAVESSTLPTGAATSAKQDDHLAAVTTRVRIPGLTFNQVLGAAGSGSETYTTGWVDVRDKPFLHVGALLPATSHVSGIIRTSSAADPDNPTSDDIEGDNSVTLAGSALGGIDTPGFIIGGGAKWAQIAVTNLLGVAYQVKVITDYAVGPSPGASLPLVAPLQKDYGAPIGRNVLAAFERGGTASHNLESDTSGNLFVRAIPEPLGELPGQNRRSGFASNVTANTTLLTVNPGKKFRMTGLTVTLFNTSTVNFGHMSLRDNGTAGTLKESWVIGTAVAGTSPPALHLSVNFTTPMDFLDNVFLHMESGTLRASVRVSGYEVDA